MNQMMKLTAVALLTGGALAVLPGCQNAGRRDDTSRPMSTTETYDQAYVATRDTQWTSTPGGTTHNLPEGTRVYFSETPGTTEWQQARVEGQGVVYVRPADYSMSSR